MYENLLYASEGATLDFKSEQYRFENETPQIKSELLKDILAFSNSWRNESAFILVGVKESKEGRATVTGIDSDLDDAQLQQFVNGKTQIPISFIYKTVNLDGKKIAVIEISQKQRPVYLKKDYGKLRSNVVYIRRGSSTTEAKPDEIYAMGVEEKEGASIPDIQLSFSDKSERKDIGPSITLEAIDIDSSNYEDMPEFSGDNHNYSGGLPSNHFIVREQPNKDYYQKLFMHYFVKMRLNKLSFCVSNKSEVLATGVKISVTIPKSTDYMLFSKSEIPEKISKFRRNNLNHIMGSVNYPKSDKVKKIEFEELSEKWVLTINVEKVLPNSVVYINDIVNFASKDNHKTIISTITYGDNIPVPIKQDLSIKGIMIKKGYDLDALIELEETNTKTS